MVNKKCLIILTAVLLSGVVTAAIYAQSTNHVSRLVGTWGIIGSNEVFVFNADGTGRLGNTNIRFGAIDNKLVIIYSPMTTAAYSFILSNDGRTLLLSRMQNGSNFGVILQRRD